MGALTEIEIFSCMAHNLRLAIEHCEDLAVKPFKGFIYNDFRKELKAIEGCCRQASAWRQDTRWLPMGLVMEGAHKRAGDWLRGVRDPETGRLHPLPEGQKHPLFVKLAENLRAMAAALDALRTRPTNRTGMILPNEAIDRAVVRQPSNYRLGGLPGGMVRRGSGLIVPNSADAR